MFARDMQVFIVILIIVCCAAYATRRIHRSLSRPPGNPCDSCQGCSLKSATAETAAYPMQDRDAACRIKRGKRQN